MKFNTNNSIFYIKLDEKIMVSGSLGRSIAISNKNIGKLVKKKINDFLIKIKGGRKFFVLSIFKIKLMIKD